MLRIGLIYGLIAGAIVVGLGTLVFRLSGGFDHAYGELFGYATMLVALSMVFFGIRQYRRQQEEEHFTFGQGLQVGLLISLVAAVIYVASWMIYYNSGGGQEMMDGYFQQQVEQVQQSADLSSDEKEAKLAEMEGFRESYGNPLVMAGFTFLEIFPVGLLVSLLAAWLLRTSSPTDQQSV